VRIEVAGEEVALLPERCLFWPKEKILAVADLHLGRAEVFRRNGLWLPPAAHASDLARLAAVAAREGAAHVIFLGDLVHSAFQLGEKMVAGFAGWRNAYAGETTVLLGNHDRGLEERWPESWRNVRRDSELRVGPFLFRHEPPHESSEAPEESYVLAGHLHPVVRLNGGADRLRLPCFFVTPNFTILPAFTELAGGYELRPNQRDRAFVTAQSRVVEIGPHAARNTSARPHE
jgi:DNA ligase-associated metallophosphoesterase